MKIMIAVIQHFLKKSLKRSLSNLGSVAGSSLLKNASEWYDGKISARDAVKNIFKKTQKSVAKEFTHGLFQEGAVNLISGGDHLVDMLRNGTTAANNITIDSDVSQLRKGIVEAAATLASATTSLLPLPLALPASYLANRVIKDTNDYFLQRRRSKEFENMTLSSNSLETQSPLQAEETDLGSFYSIR